MSNVKMPDPVAWVRRHPDGALTAEYLENEVISEVRKQSGAWLPLITTDQAEAYADARVRETLEEAASIIETNAAGCNETTFYILHSQIEAIRALIPK